MPNLTPTTQIDIVIKYIQSLIDSGELLPGGKLPAERRLAEHLGVSRVHVRTAIQKLEFYGIVKTFPQSGTIVSEQKGQVLESLISDMLQIAKYDFASLVHVRVLLEVDAVKYSALNRTEEDLKEMEKALAECDKYFDTDRKVEKDFAFHQAVVRGAHNPVISSLLLVITPDVLSYYQKYKVCNIPKEIVSAEHHELLKYIREQRPNIAETILRKHLLEITKFSIEKN